MGEEIKSYIENLFQYLEKYENNYAQFSTEAFLQNYNGIVAVFQALRQQRDKAVEVDRFFLEKIKLAPLSSSDLRQIAIQVLISFFESEADTDGQSNKAYLFVRDLRPTKRDVAYFEEHLVPILFREGSLNNNFELNEFFLNEIARFMTKFARPVQADLSPEAFNSLSNPLKFLELYRRRRDLGEDLLKDRGSLEFHMQNVGAFDKLAQKGKLYDHYLSRWNYLVKTSFWSKVTAFFGELWSKFIGLFTSFRYFRLSLAQRNAAYFFYGLLIVVFILLAVLVPGWWSDYSQDKLDQLENRAAETQEAVSK